MVAGEIEEQRVQLIPTNEKVVSLYSDVKESGVANSAI